MDCKKYNLEAFKQIYTNNIITYCFKVKINIRIKFTCKFSKNFGKHLKDDTSL